MPRKILLIESDAGFARELADALEAAGFEVRATADGKEGLDFARDWAPDAAVLCVELPRMSGYVICQKLKKDDALKAIPLVLTSSEATTETFEKHRQLKVRAEAYLIKPFEPAALVEALASIGVEGERAGGGEEEVVSLEEEMGLEALSSEPESSLPALNLDALPDEPAASADAPAGGDDEDLRMLDDAFAGIAAPAAPASDGVELEIEGEGERPVPGDEVDAAAASLPELDEAPARADIARIEEEADRALGALSEGDEPAAESPFDAAVLDERPAPASFRGASADLLRAAGIPVLDDPAPPAPRGADDEPARFDRGGAARDAELRETRAQLDELVRRAEAAEAASAAKDADAKALRARADALSAQVKRAEGDARAAKDDARRTADRLEAAERRAREAEDALAEARRRADDAEAEARAKAAEAAEAADAIAKVEALERELEELKTELVVARGEAEGARGEVEKRTAELRKRVEDLQGAASKHEERVLKAYQKIKADEKMRDKVRKALAIAQQLLDEGLQPEPAAEKPRAAAVGGRD
jgi:CheY-like chemotaxis protein/predicted  nucleic acid-binding Zn-ribbon protein